MVAKLAKLLRVIVIAGLALLLVASSLVAATPGGTGPEDALYPTDEWRVLEPGATHWYMFRDKGKSAQITVDLHATDLNGVTFEVWTEADKRMWAAGQEFDPVGRGSHSIREHHLIWSGNFNMSGNCLVVVKNKADAARAYNLDIAGKDVYFPTFQPAEIAPRAVVQPPEVIAEAVTDGPMSIDGAWNSVGQDESLWYAFKYKGKNKDILIRMNEDVAGRAAFAVYTPSQYADKMAGKKVEPIGRSAMDPFKSKSTIWYGSFPDKGTYYVQVTHTNQIGFAAFSLNITSTGLVR